MNPSPRAHVYRLLAVLAVAGTIFLVVKWLATPASWDFDAWYRTGALEDLKHQPLAFGGNMSCMASTCHEDERYLIEDAQSEHRLRHEMLRWATHKTLACEACHGPLQDHASDGKKIAKAIIVRENTLCLRCHERRLGRDAVAHVSETFEYHEALDVTRESTCVDCHNPHEPK